MQLSNILKTTFIFFREKDSKCKEWTTIRLELLINTLMAYIDKNYPNEKSNFQNNIYNSFVKSPTLQLFSNLYDNSFNKADNMNQDCKNEIIKFFEIIIDDDYILSVGESQCDYLKAKIYFLKLYSYIFFKWAKTPFNDIKDDITHFNKLTEKYSIKYDHQKFHGLILYYPIDISSNYYEFSNKIFVNNDPFIYELISVLNSIAIKYKKMEKQKLTFEDILNAKSSPFNQKPPVVQPPIIQPPVYQSKFLDKSPIFKSQSVVQPIVFKSQIVVQPPEVQPPEVQLSVAKPLVDQQPPPVVKPPHPVVQPQPPPIDQQHISTPLNTKPLETLSEFKAKIEKIKSDNSIISTKTTIPAILRKETWDTYIGSEDVCFCCRKKNISPFEFDCGHIISKSKGGPTSIENLRPICSLCNSSMGIINMYEFINIYKLWGYSEIFCQACDNKIFNTNTNCSKCGFKNKYSDLSINELKNKCKEN